MDKHDPLTAAPYEAPLQAERVIDSGCCGSEESIELLQMLRRRGVLAPAR